jgi:ELWxxDGT repeat protein
MLLRAIVVTIGMAWAAMHGYAMVPGGPPEPLSIEDALADNTIEAATFAPDAKTAAIVTCHGAEPVDAQTGFTPSGFFASRRGCRVSVVEVASGKPVALPIGDGTSLSPVSSPDGKSLAFFSDRDGIARIWTIDLQTRTAKRISEVPVRFTHHLTDPALQWSPDGRRLLARFIPQDQTLEQAMAAYDRVVYGSKSPSTILVYRAGEARESTADLAARTDVDFTTRMLPYDTDFGLVEVATGRIRYVTRNAHPRWAGFSSDGRYIAYQDWKGSVPGAGQVYYFDTSIMEVESGRILKTVRHATSFHYLAFSSWSPTGRLFTFSDCRFLTTSGDEIDLRTHIKPGEWSPFDRARCGALWNQQRDLLHVLELESRGTPQARARLWTIDPLGPSRKRVATIPGDEAHLVAPRTLNRAWVPGGSNSVIAISLGPGDRRAVFSRIGLDSGDVTVLSEMDRWVGDAPERAVRDVSRDDRLLFAAEDASHPEELWVTDASFKNPSRVSNANPHLQRYTFGGSRLVEWKSADDGRPLRGALFLPADYEPGRRYPVIVRVYPEAQSRYLNTYAGGTRLDNGHLWTTRGYAVFLPDGYFAPGRPQAGMIASVLPGIDKLIALGIADADRIGIYGHSNGGYSTLALLTQTSRFKAAVATAGPYDLWSAYGEMDQGGTSDILSNLEQRLGGSPWEFRDRYIDNSPTFHLDRITTPLLLFHGQLDSVPVHLANHVFVGMRRLGKTVEYVKYMNEGHTFRNRVNETDYLQRVIKWYEKYLGPSSSTDRTREGPGARERPR